MVANARPLRDDEIEVILRDNTTVKTGCRMPVERPTRVAAYSGRLLDEDEARKLAENPDRIRAREIYKGEDWIFHQKNSDCNGQAGAGCEQTVCHRMGRTWEPLSGEYLYAHINGGRDQGSMLDDGMAFLEEHGCAPQRLVQHGVWRLRDITAEAKGEAPRFKGHKPFDTKTEQQLVSGILLGGCAVVAVHVDSDFSELDDAGFVPPSNTGPGNHAVRVDDCWYDLRLGCWCFDSPNSWGLRWGQGGRGIYTWKRHFIRTVKVHQFYVIPCGQLDPQFPIQDLKVVA